MLFRSPGGIAVVSYPNPRVLYGIWKTRGWYPVVRAAKRLAGLPPFSLPKGSPRVHPASFIELLTAAQLRTAHVEYTSFLVVPSPLDQLLPRTTERLGWWLEGSGRRLGPRLAGQVVYAARRSHVTPDAPVGTPHRQVDSEGG